MIAPRTGPHAVDDRNAGTACQPVAISGSGQYCTFKDGRRQCAPALCPIVP